MSHREKSTKKLEECNIVHKKGDLTDHKKLTTVSLLSAVKKLFSKAIANIIIRHLRFKAGLSSWVMKLIFNHGSYSEIKSSYSDN